MITFTIPGEPVGKGRARAARRGPKIIHYTPEKTASYENLVKLVASQAMMGRPPVKLPVSCDISLTVTPPASWSKKKRAEAILSLIHPTSKPDIDNVVKCIFDAMNAIVFDDDKQVVSLTVTKTYSETAQATVSVTEIGGER